jgi:hypothetical protein
LEAVFTLAQAGKTKKNGIPGLLQFASLSTRYPDTMYPAFPPFPILKVLLKVLGVATLLGLPRCGMTRGKRKRLSRLRPAGFEPATLGLGNRCSIP